MSVANLSIQGVCKNFRGLAALNTVSFDAEEGAITAIIGPNGAGKTTLFNLIAGDHTPTEGRILFQESEISGLSPDRICRLGISRTYQKVRPFHGLSVSANVRVAMLYGRREAVPAARIDEEIGVILEFVHLGAEPGKLASGLTPLERKRLELARALATDPRVLLLDEIIAGLGPAETLEMMETIRAINDRGITILLIEHVMRAVMGLSKHIVVLHHGEKIAEGDPAEVTADREVIKAYLGDAAVGGSAA